MKKSIAFFLFLLPSILLSAQDIDPASYRTDYKIHIRRTSAPVKIDGLLDDAGWQQADTASSFWLKAPRDDARARHQTIARLMYDEHFLYVGFIASDSMPLIGQSLKRDSRIRDNDGVGIVLDPIGKKTNGFYFTVTAFNVQADDLVTVNPDNLNFSWDNKWYSAVKRFDNYYTVEIAIPFKTLRYNSTNTTWGVNFVRSDRKQNEIHTWTRIPVNFSTVDLGYTGGLYWDQPPPKPGNNISLIPYVTASVESDNVNDRHDVTATAGLDAKIALNSSLNLDLTCNPDFSQVEVDRQVTNLSRFSIFFPERRNFFLENNDLFSEYGIPPIRPFYSRRIGLDPNGQPIPILAGLRLSGNIAEATRIGILSMQTKATADYAAQNYTAVTVQQQLLQRTTAKAYFFNRQGFADDAHPLTDPLEKYGRNAGGELFFVNEKGNWQGWLGSHGSFKPGKLKNNFYHNGGGGYFGRRLTTFINADDVGTNYHADMGFVERIENYDAANDTVIRLGFRQFYQTTQYSFFPKKGPINQHRIELENFLVLNPNHSFNEWSIDLGYDIAFKNTASIGFSLSRNNVQLPFHTSFTDGTPLPPAKYGFTQAGLSASTDNRKPFSLAGEITVGKYFSGNYTQLAASAIFRRQPWLTIEINAEYNRLRFPAPYGSDELFLVAPRVEINFSNKLFWTTFIQYNTQANNVNINSRFQWRYKPASDLFIVYTDNYYSDPFLKNKSRALVLKFQYWLNL